MLTRSPASVPGHRTLTFTLPAEWADRVSVVGNFNDWTPGQLTLVADGDVARASVVVANDYTAVFRYLGEGDHWFDEPEADHVDAGGSVVLPVTDETTDAAQVSDDVAAQPRQPATPNGRKRRGLRGRIAGAVRKLTGKAGRKA